MTSQQMDALVSALDTAEIDIYSLAVDTPTYYYNDKKTQFIIPDNSKDGIHAVKKNGFGGAYSYFSKDFGCCYHFVDYADIHEFRTAGTPDKMQKFLEALNLNLTDEQVTILKWMQESTSDLRPITGDYTFKPISQEEYDALTPEEKAIYDERLKQYNLRKAGISGQASISVQMG